ncbi:MAG TPA: hypothetical protein VFQ22_01090 [Longimicrobiales bacterium]|nr:hypothetical protein [Longimicrobiales bacterium]
MTEQRRTGLKELQRLDSRIEEARRRIADFDPRLEEIEQPALALESELNTTRTRLQEMRLEERRLELSSEEKRVRRQRLEERLGTVRNLREEAAVSAELEMVKRALQSDEQEALSLIDQIRKMEVRASELEAAFQEASELVEPKRRELLDERAEAQRNLDALGAERAAFASGLPPAELKVYEAIRSGGRTIAVAELTYDGACGHCYGMVPLQLQYEIRHGSGLIRCESCGVILTAPEPEASAAEASGNGADGEQVASVNASAGESAAEEGRDTE